MSKESSLGTRIIVSLIAITASSIATINLLTVFGILKSPDLMGYAGLVGLFLLPLVVIGAALNKIITEEKRAFQQMAEMPSTSGAKIELKIKFKENETIMGDTTSHPGYYVKISIASVLSVATGLFTFLFVSEGFTGDLINMFPLLLPLIVISATIHIFSKHLFDPGGWRVFLEHTWLTLFVIGISISGLMTLQNYIRATYPKNFWESFMGLPFSLITILFLFIMLLIGGILIRLGDIFSLETSSLKSSGLSIVLVSIAFLVPQFNIIDWNLLLSFISQGFSILLTIYGIATAILFYQNAGMRVLITNERIIKLDTRKLENSSYYPLKYLKNIKIIQDFVSKRMGYGNIVTTFYKGKRNLEKVLCILYGVKKPKLLANTIRALADINKKKSKPAKKKPLKKKEKPVKKKKKKPLRKKKIKKRKKKEDGGGMYYKSIIPLLFVASIVLVSLTSAGMGVVNTDISTSIKTRSNGSGELIHDSFEIDYVNSSYIEIDTIHEIYEYTYGEEKYNSSELRELYVYQRNEIREALSDDFQRYVALLLNSTYGLDKDSEDAVIESDFYLDENSFQEGGDSDPVVFTGYVSIRLKPSYFSLPKEADMDEVFYGTMKIGGELKHDFSFPCEPGHLSHYELIPPDDLLFRIEDGEETSSFSITIDNMDGSETLSETSQISLVHEDRNVIHEKNIITNLTIDILELKRSAEREYIMVDINLTGSFFSAPVPPHISSKLPEDLELRNINSAFLRLMYMNGFKEDIDSFFMSFEKSLKNRFEEVADRPIDDVLSIKNIEKGYNTSVMSSETPINFYFNTSFENTITEYETSTESLKTKYLIEQTVSFRVGSFEYSSVNYTLYVPPGLQMTEARAGQEHLDIHIDNDGRYYIQDSIPMNEDYKLVLKIGTIVDIGSLIPFFVAILVLLITWLGLQSVPKRKKKSPYYEA
ncbi:MAG: hypothetical protein ACQESD_02080 [Thermoplasmatota archaeon]